MASRRDLATLGAGVLATAGALLVVFGLVRDATTVAVGGAALLACASSVLLLAVARTG